MIKIKKKLNKNGVRQKEFIQLFNLMVFNILHLMFTAQMQMTRYLICSISDCLVLYILFLTFIVFCLLWSSNFECVYSVLASDVSKGTDCLEPVMNSILMFHVFD